MLALTHATETLAGVVRRIRDDDLSRPTPCERLSVRDVLAHVDGLAFAFTEAAAKELDGVPGAGAPPPAPEDVALDDGWRERVPARLADLAKAWQDPAAWQGMTAAGGVELPGEVCGLVALDEVVVHAWDLAVATGQPYTPSLAAVEGALEFVRAAVDENPAGTPGLFAAPVAVPDDATALERLLGLTGRDPAWKP